MSVYSERKVEPVKLSTRQLKAILRCLPAPNSAEISLYGFDYSQVYNQARRSIPNMELDVNGGFNCTLQNPSREMVLDIYKKFSKKTKSQKRIQLDQVTWRLGRNYSRRVDLVLSQVEIKYGGNRGKEPEYISKLMATLGRIHVPWTLENLK